MIALKHRLASGDPSIKSEIADLESSLKVLMTEEYVGAKIRSRAKWLEEGEAPTKFFLKLASQRFEKSFVSSVLNSDGVEASALPEIMKAHEVFYSSLFAEESVDLETENHLLSFVLRRLSDADREVCDGALLLDEATEAVGLSNRNKAPGPDGLSVEFYLTFWSCLGPLLVEVFNEGLRASELCDSMKTSITCLVYNKDDRGNLKNWCPISLKC